VNARERERERERGGNRTATVGWLAAAAAKFCRVIIFWLPLLQLKWSVYCASRLKMMHITLHNTAIKVGNKDIRFL
jgi:hypothetical protein